MGETGSAADDATVTGGSPGSVFVSYSRPDRARAAQVVALLEGAGCKVWWDGQLEGGQAFLPEIEAALTSADAVVVLWSVTAVASHWVRDEAEQGRVRGCLVPLGLDGTEPPLGFRQVQVVDIARWRGRADDAEALAILRAVFARFGAEVPAIPRRVPKRSRRNVLIGAGAATLAAGIGGVGFAVSRGLLRLPGSVGENSVAVMPFQNLSPDRSQAWFSDGLSEEVRAVLARNPRLHVAAPASSVSLRDAGDDVMAVSSKLGVANVLRGSVQRSGDAVRITAELVRGSDAMVRWAERFDRKLSDVFALQTEIAETVAVALVAEVAGDDVARQSAVAQRDIGGTSDVAAHDAYLRGRAYFELSAGEETDRAALAQFEAAISRDGNYAQAHAMRSTMLAAIANETGDSGAVRGLYASAIEAAQRAIALAPELAQGHLALGYALNNGELATAAALPHYRRARDLAIGDADVLRSAATYFAFAGDNATAAPLAAKAIRLDPLNARVFRTAGYVAYAARDFGDAMRQMRKAIELNNRIATAHFSIGNVLLAKGDAKAALEEYRQEATPLFALAGSAIARARLGDQAGAKRDFDKLVADFGNNGLYQQAQVLAQWNDVPAALDRLRKAREVRDAGLLLAPTDWMLDPLRKEGDFGRLLTGLTAR
ncbi:TIR domain-containing protein [Novosphingobium olei]|nr:TIR domain-containing protein [Novosphingobium olei]